MAYFRAGYTPDDYPADAEWEGRLLIERSFAVKCPSIGQHLAGTKKVQQVLADPAMLARFVSPEQAAGLSSCFAGLHGLDEAHPPPCAHPVHSVHSMLTLCLPSARHVLATCVSRDDFPLRRAASRSSVPSKRPSTLPRPTCSSRSRSMPTDQARPPPVSGRAGHPRPEPPSPFAPARPPAGLWSRAAAARPPRRRPRPSETHA